MTTHYTKEYADNSHIHMDSAADYAKQLYNYRSTFEAFAEQYPNMAVSSWGVDVALELTNLLNRIN